MELLDKDKKNFRQFFLTKMQSKTMKRGEMVYKMKGPILVLTWIDNKPVTISGTTTGIPEEQVPVLEVQNKEKDGTLENVACPPIVSAYNCYMLHVTKRSNEVLLWYYYKLSGMKWWTGVFFDLIDRAIFNGKVLFIEFPHTLKKKSLKDFKVDLVKLLVGNFCSRQKHGRSSLDNQ